MSEVINKFAEKHKGKEGLNHVLDYLKSEYSHRKSINFSFEQAKEKAKDWTDRLNKKNAKKIKNSKNVGEVELVLDFDDGFKLVRLIDQRSKDWEGYQMNHCVSSYKNHPHIYSLRNKNNIPKCTFELNFHSYHGYKILAQIEGKNNNISQKYAEKILTSLEYLGIKDISIALKKLGVKSNFDEDWVQENFTGYKIIQLKNTKYLFDKNARLKKPIKNPCVKLLRFAIYNNLIDDAILLIELGTDLYKKAAFGSSPIELIFEHNRSPLIKYLIKNNLIKKNNSLSILLEKCMYKNVVSEEIRYLLFNSYYNEIPNKDKLFNYFLETNQITYVKLFVQKGYNFSQNNQILEKYINYYNPSNDKVFKYLLEQKESPFIKSLSKIGILITPKSLILSLIILAIYNIKLLLN